METIKQIYQMFPAPVFYLFILIAVVFLIGVILWIIKFVKKEAKILSGKKYRKNPAGSNLTTEQQAALNIGAINSEQTMYYADSLLTGDSKNSLYSNLAKYYGISKVLSPAKEVLDWMYESGHRIYYNALIETFLNTPKAQWKKFVKENFPKDRQTDCREYLEHLDETIPTLIKEGFIKEREDLANISILAWDMGRLVNITRGCWECGFITESEAWEYINCAYDKSKAVYKDWNEFAAGYVIGRAMMGGNSLMLPGIMNIAKDLQVDADSPWQQLPLQ